MAELAAASAVSSLLGVMRNEALLLGRVGSDVQFIKAEMESMNGFLAHLARTSPPDREHDEQVRAWMAQVRALVHDCNNCLDLYLYRRRGNRDIHRAMGGVWSYVWWAPWFVQKMVAQHQAAAQLRELKDRARDVGERRLRYGVEVPAKAKAKAAGQPSSSASHPDAGGSAADDAAGDDDDDDDEAEEGDDPAAANWRAGLQLVQPRALEDYFRDTLRRWIQEAGKKRDDKPAEPVPCIAVVVPDTAADAGAVAGEALSAAAAVHSGNVDWVVDVSEARAFYGALYHRDILCYMLWMLKPAEQRAGEYMGWRPWRERNKAYYEIRRKVGAMNLWAKMERIREKIGEVMEEVKQLQPQAQDLDSAMEIVEPEPLGLLHLALKQLLKPADIQPQRTAAGSNEQQKGAETADQDKAPSSTAETDKKEHKLSPDDKKTLQLHEINETAKKLREFIEKDSKGDGAISLDAAVYESILNEMFPHAGQATRRGFAMATPRITTDDNTGTTCSTSGESHLTKEMVYKFTREMMHDVLEDTVKKLAAASNKPTQDQTSDASATEDMAEKIRKIPGMIEDQMFVKGLADKVRKELKGARTVFIIKDEKNNLPADWKKTRNNLSMLGASIRGAVIVTTRKNTQRAKEYCDPPEEPIAYSLSSLYHEWLLRLPYQPVTEDKAKISRVLRGILDKCEPHEFCMKIFAHALYASPKRSIDELHKLEITLVPEKLDNTQQTQVPDQKLLNAKKLFKFSYNNLPKEYRSCLLYLAIFPPGHIIRRSTLVGRWVVEGLIAKEDWHASVHRAERCFDSLVDRWLVQPVHFGAAGKVKSCMVGGPIHAFITKIAKKQHILEARLSHHLARHFSIFNDLRLRRSDDIGQFLKNLCASSRFLHLKVLDLEKCRPCFGENQYYLQEICRKISLLKYLGLRGTDITWLPMEINQLHELEALDIRDTTVLVRKTKRVILLKLKRLLSGQKDSPDRSVRIPAKIGKMVDMEILSSVQASESGKELKDIGKLWQLRKLGVVIKDMYAHLSNLLQAISDLHECLQSLSITLTTAATGEPSSSNTEVRQEFDRILADKPKVLESLTINGTTKQVQILPLLLEKGDNRFLTNVTLRNTSLNQEDLKVLAALPMLLCVRFRDKAYKQGSSLTLKANEFQKLNSFIVEGSNMGGIKFEKGAVPELKKVILSSYDIQELSGVENLPELAELELSNSNKLLPSFAKAKAITSVTLRDHVLEESQVAVLAEKKNIHCLVLLGSSSEKEDLTFKENSFPDLNLITIVCPGITGIHFSKGSAPKLKKIIWSITGMKTLSGIENLPKLKDIEINGGVVPPAVEEVIKKNGIQLHNKPEEKQDMGNKEEEKEIHAGFWTHWRR